MARCSDSRALSLLVLVISTTFLLAGGCGLFGRAQQREVAAANSGNVGRTQPAGTGEQAESAAAKSSRATLTWTGYDGKKEKDPQHATYVLNGREVGTGDTGFRAALELIKGLPRGSELMIYPDAFVIWAIRDPTGGGYLWDYPEWVEASVPYRHDWKLVRALQDVITERDIHAWYLPELTDEADERYRDWRLPESVVDGYFETGHMRTEGKMPQ